MTLLMPSYQIITNWKRNVSLWASYFRACEGAGFIDKKCTSSRFY